jgi:polyisoprenoid-binding protein YceI
MGVAPFQGVFREFEATLDEQGLRGVANASSIDVDNEDLTAHLAAPDFFDAASHPKIAFETSELRREGDAISVDGVLVIKGNRAPVSLTGSITDPVSDPWGGRKLGRSPGRSTRTPSASPGTRRCPRAARCWPTRSS